MFVVLAPLFPLLTTISHENFREFVDYIATIIIIISQANLFVLRVLEIKDKLHVHPGGTDRNSQGIILWKLYVTRDDSCSKASCPITERYMVNQIYAREDSSKFPISSQFSLS